MLDERKTAILRAVVQEYIETAQPVGSGHVASASGVNVSSATVRNEMAVLEQEGYLQQPHTSAGRVPTDKGYRYFVDHLVEPGRLDGARSREVRDFFDSAHGAIEQMLHDTSGLLARLTDYAAVVIAPQQSDTASLRSVQLVPLSSRVVLLVAVLSNGFVCHQPLEFDADVGEERVSAATAHLCAQLLGRSVGALGDVAASGDPATDDLVTTALAAVRASVRGEDEQVYVGGASRMASSFDAVEVVRNVLVTLEEQYVVVSLLRDVLSRGLTVAIGAEHGIEPLAACSVVVAPYVVEGMPAGTIGVLGPTRMNYPHALAAVDIVSERLGRRLSEG